MSLETATYINQLDAANPLGSDPIASGDDHIRLIKSALKATFPNITGPVTATQGQLNAPFPVGGIVMWSGASNAIPSGWALCNGANGTPDLRGRFVIGAAGSYAVGNTGGAESVTLSQSQLPSHSHSASSSSSFSGNAMAGHSHTIYVNDPGHNHQYKTYGLGNNGLLGNAYTNYDWGYANTANTYTGVTASAASVSAGTPSGSVSTTTTIGATGSGAAVDIRNPYYALCYIMKV